MNSDIHGTRVYAVTVTNCHKHLLSHKVCLMDIGVGLTLRSVLIRSLRRHQTGMIQSGVTCQI